MKIKLIKLIKNELIKIFKRKSIYILLIISVLVIIIYNYNSPDQNKISYPYNSNLGTLPLENIDYDIERYITYKTINDFSELFNKYDKDSWQKCALSEELKGYNIGNIEIQIKVIESYLNTINDYELNENSNVTIENYEEAKEKYNNFVKVLDEDNWREYTHLKINELTEKKNTNSNENINGIDVEIEICKLRLEYNINYSNNILNDYIETYRRESYYLMYQTHKNETNIKEYKEKIELAKYAIQNNIEQDISQQNYHIIWNNKVDARNSFIRTFKNFDLIIVVIAIYIACNTLTEETNKKTIKNLLTKPHKRSEILISKILACIIVIIISMIFVIISQYIVGGIIFGFDSYNLNYIGYSYNAEEIVNMNLLGYILLVGLSKLPMYSIIIVFCIFIGVINNNTSMTIILTLIMFIISNIIISGLSTIDTISVITRFFVTNNWDYSIYLFGHSSEIPGVNLGFSIMIYSIYLLILLKLSVQKFNNKDIVN